MENKYAICACTHGPVTGFGIFKALFAFLHFFLPTLNLKLPHRNPELPHHTEKVNSTTEILQNPHVLWLESLLNCYPCPTDQPQPTNQPQTTKPTKIPTTSEPTSNLSKMQSFSYREQSLERRYSWTVNVSIGFDSMWRSQTLTER